MVAPIKEEETIILVHNVNNEGNKSGLSILIEDLTITEILYYILLSPILIPVGIFLYLYMQYLRILIKI